MSLGLCGCGSSGTSDGPAETTQPPPSGSEPSAGCSCGPLAEQEGETLVVGDVGELLAAVAAANERGDVSVLLEDGEYRLSGMLWISGDGLTIRSRSGNREAVVIRGDGMWGSVSHVFNVVGSRFTLADVTVGWVRNHAVQIHSSSDAPRIHNVRLIDTGEQLLKVSYVPGDPASSENGEVSCSSFEYSAGIGPQFYIGGIDAHQAYGWVVRDNVFRGIRSPESDLAEHAVHFWSFSRDTLVERNIINDCDRGIGLGLGDRGHVGGLVRNNLVRTTRDVGIGLESASGARLLHNTVVAEGYPNAIEYRFGLTTDVEIVNNLTAGEIVARDGAAALTSHNITHAGLEWFVDAASGNLRLAAPEASVVDQAEPTASVDLDIDCEARPKGPASDIGADEW